MTKAIEHIVAGYSTLKNRKALEEIRDHRKRLLMENRMNAASSGFNRDQLNQHRRDRSIKISGSRIQSARLTSRSA